MLLLLQWWQGLRLLALVPRPNSVAHFTCCHGEFVSEGALGTRPRFTLFALLTLTLLLPLKFLPQPHNLLELNAVGLIIVGCARRCWSRLCSRRRADWHRAVANVTLRCRLLLLLLWLLWLIRSSSRRRGWIGVWLLRRHWCRCRLLVRSDNVSLCNGLLRLICGWLIDRRGPLLVALWRLLRLNLITLVTLRALRLLLMWLLVRCLGLGLVECLCWLLEGSLLLGVDGLCCGAVPLRLVWRRRRLMRRWLRLIRRCWVRVRSCWC